MRAALAAAAILILGLLCSAPVVLARLGEGLVVLFYGGAVALVLLGAGGGVALVTLAQGEATRRALGAARRLPPGVTIIEGQAQERR